MKTPNEASGSKRKPAQQRTNTNEAGCEKTPDARQILAGTLGTTGVTKTTIDMLAEHARVRTFGPNRTVWAAGETPECLTIIARGMVKIVRKLPNGESVTMGIFGPRDAVGLLAVLDRNPYPGDAVVISRRLVVVTVPASVFHAAMATDATLARALSMRLAKHARILLTKISIVASGPVQVRLATLLLSLAERYGDELDDGSTCVPVDLTRKTMGEFIEARVETVIRMLSVWQRDGVIADSDRGVLITNMELLRQRAASA